MKPILVISIDDSFEYAINIASILDQNELRGSFFLDVGRIGRTMNKSTVRRLAESHEVGSHSVTHRQMTKIPLSECLNEIRESKRRLEEITGKTVASFAFPYGDENKTLRRLVLAEGYRCARGARQGQCVLPSSVDDMNVSLLVTPRRLKLLLQLIGLATSRDDSKPKKIVLPFAVPAIMSVFFALPHLPMLETRRVNLLHILLHPYNFRHTCELDLIDRFLRVIVDSAHPVNLTVSELAQAIGTGWSRSN